MGCRARYLRRPEAAPTPEGPMDTEKKQHPDTEPTSHPGTEEQMTDPPGTEPVLLPGRRGRPVAGVAAGTEFHLARAAVMRNPLLGVGTVPLLETDTPLLGVGTPLPEVGDSLPAGVGTARPRAAPDTEGSRLAPAVEAG